MIARRASLVGVLAFGLSACAEPFPEDFTISVDGTTALGFYKPAEFTQAEIKGGLAHLCTGGAVSNYTEEVGPDGTTFFGANCAATFNAGQGTVYVTRTPNGSLRYDLP